MFAWERRNAEPKEKKTEPPKLGPDPDLERALAKYGDQISRTVRDILPILMEPSDTKATAEYERELSRWNERRCAASVNCRYEEREHEFERLIDQADARSATAARICNVRRVACGLSQATNSTPESIIVAINATFRESATGGLFLHVESTPGTAQITSNLLNRSRRGAGRPTVAGHHHRRPARSAPQSYFAGGGGGGRCLMLVECELILVASNG